MDEDKVLLRIIKLEEDVADIKENMVTKSEFFESLNGQDKIIGILTTMQTEMAATNHALLRHEDRIEKLEKDVAGIQSQLANA